MKGVNVLGWSGLVLSIMANSAIVWAQETPGKVDRLIVRFKSEPGFSASSLPSPAATRALDSLESTTTMKTQLIKKMSDGAQVVKLTKAVDRSELLALLYQLSNDPDVDYAEPDLWMRPSADAVEYQWHLNDTPGGINAQSAWDLSQGKGTVVAVIDSGVLPHGDLLDNLLPGYDLIKDIDTAADGDGRDADASDPGDFQIEGSCADGIIAPSTWHGTKMAGIIAATNNNSGVLGVAYDTKILPVRVLGRCGGYTSDIVDGMYWSMGQSNQLLPKNPNPADIINLSVNTDNPVLCGESYQNAINKANAAGKIVIVSAGNYGSSKGYPPANCNGVLAVAATKKNGSLANYSNTGNKIQIAAPGGVLNSPDDLTNKRGIISTSNSGFKGALSDTYTQDSGTSFSAAIVSGVVALMKSAYPQATYSDIVGAIKSTATPFASDCNGCGAGIINAGAAVQAIVEMDIVSRAVDLAVTLVRDNGYYVPMLGSDQGIIQFKVVIENSGENTALDVLVSLDLPADTSIQSIITDGVAVCDEEAGSCSMAELASGSTETLSVRVATTNTQMMKFAVAVDTDQPELDESDNNISAMFGGSLGTFMTLGLLGLWLFRLQARKQPAVKQFQ